MLQEAAWHGKGLPQHGMPWLLTPWRCCHPAAVPRSVRQLASALLAHHPLPPPPLPAGSEKESQARIKRYMTIMDSMTGEPLSRCEWVAKPLAMSSSLVVMVANVTCTVWQVSRCALGLGQTADALLGMHSLATGRGGACHVFIRRTEPGLPSTNLAQDLD